MKTLPADLEALNREKEVFEAVSASMQNHGVTLTAHGVYWAALLYEEAWKAATERAAVTCEETDVVEVRGPNSYYCQLGDAAATRAACAAAIRAASMREGGGS